MGSEDIRIERQLAVGEVKKINVALGAGLWRPMFARIENGEIIQLATSKEQLEMGDNGENKQES